MRALQLSKAEFDANRNLVEALTRDWADRECTTFDEAVKGKDPSKGTGSIWQMPSIDSKRVVSLLVELEPVFGCNLPPSLIRRGGYANAQQLEKDLLTRIRERCSDDSTSAPVATPPKTEIVVADVSKRPSL